MLPIHRSLRVRCDSDASRYVTEINVLYQHLGGDESLEVGMCGIRGA